MKCSFALNWKVALNPGRAGLTWVWLNPLTSPIEHVRAALFLGETPAWGTFFMALAIAYGVAWAGLVWFQKTRPSFADVL